MIQDVVRRVVTTLQADRFWMQILAASGSAWNANQHYDAQSIKQLRHLYHRSRGAFSKHRRFCPYGRELFNGLLTGWRPRNGVWVYAGIDAWKHAKQNKTLIDVLVLPWGEVPGNLFWPVYGLDCIVSPDKGITAEELRALAAELVCCGSPLVVVTDDLQRLGYGTTSFKPEGITHG